jgi:uncharacterized membrane protein
MDIGKFHVLLVHFPIALAVAAVVADLLRLITRRTFFRGASLYCLAAAIIATPPVLVTGYLLSTELFPPGTAATIADRVEDHEDMALVSFGVMIGAAVVRGLWAWKPAKWQPAVYGLLMAALLVCIAITGDLGGKLVYGADFLSNIF